MYPVHSQQLKKEGVVPTCMKTGQAFEPLAVTLVKRPIIIVCGFQYMQWTNTSKMEDFLVLLKKLKLFCACDITC